MIMNVVGLDEIKKVFEKRMHKQVGKKGTKLSGGQRQIVVILRALIIKCKVIILDEPTSSLDDINKNKILSLIKYICNNRTVIIISHDENILKIIDTKYKLENKKIIKI